MDIHNIFNIVIQATIFGSVVGLIILVLKSTVLKKLAAKWQYLLWSVMIFKLIIPKGPESRISIFNKINVTEKISETDLISIAYKPQPITEVPPVQRTFEIYDIVPYIWLLGFIIALLWTVISFALLKHKIHSSSCEVSNNTMEILENCKEKMGIKKKIGILAQNHIQTTSLCGVIKPKIIITKDFEIADINHMEYTFIHELSHYKRGDIAMIYLLLFLRCIHWFNPVIWFLFSKIRRDTELATDECTMSYINPEECKSYGLTLINTLSMQSRKSVKLLGMANNKNDITARIKAIAKFKKPGFVQHLSGILTVILISSVCLTSAAVAKAISRAIYSSIPIVKNEDTEKNTLSEFLSQEIISLNIIEKPELKDDIDNKTEYENENLKEEKSEHTVEEKSEPIVEYGHFENMSIDTVINLTGQILDNSGNTTDLNQFAKMVYYNTDYDGSYRFNVIPNDLGYIQLFVENEGFDHDVYIGVYHVDSKGRGWDYCFNTKTKTPIYLDGYEPGEEYVVTISCYCPGHYDINGRILVY